MTAAADPDGRARESVHTAAIPTSSTDVVAAAGLSYRKLDYYARRGYLRPEGNNNGKPGWRRYWPDREIDVAITLARLTDAGLGLDVAARAARSIVDAWYAAPAPARPACVQLAEGVVVEVTPRRNA